MSTVSRECFERLAAAVEGVDPQTLARRVQENAQANQSACRVCNRKLYPGKTLCRIGQGCRKGETPS